MEPEKYKQVEHKIRRQRRNLEELYPDDGLIIILCASNPKREGTDAHFRFEQFFTKRTVAKAVNAGVARRHIDEDVSRGFIRVEKPEDTTDAG